MTDNRPHTEILTVPQKQQQIVEVYKQVPQETRYITFGGPLPMNDMSYQLNSNFQPEKAGFQLFQIAGHDGSVE